MVYLAFFIVLLCVQAICIMAMINVSIDTDYRNALPKLITMMVISLCFGIYYI